MTPFDRFRAMRDEHPLLLAFALTAIEKYADQILAMDKARWPENHLVSFDLWQSLAARAKKHLLP